MKQKISTTGANAGLFAAVFLFSFLSPSAAMADPVTTSTDDEAATATTTATAPAASTPDKSQYSLFNPTPDSALRSFCTDRPTKSNLPCTVDAGHWQYEADALNWTYSDIGGTKQNTYLFTNPTVKLGLTNKSDLELNIAPVETVTTHNKATGANTSQTGNGDLYTRVKYNLVGDDSGDVAVTLLPYVKIPTAEPGIGNKAFEEGVIVPVSFNLPMNFSLVLDPEFDNFKDADGSGYHDNYQGLVNISHTVFSSNITAYAELWSGINEDPSGTIRQSSADFAVTWLVRPTLQLDVGTNIGLNAETPNVQAYTGISQRF